MNADQIKHVTNQFERYTSTKTFALGSTGINIPYGAELLFDGSTVMFDEAKYMMPTLRGAIRLGWLVLTSQYDSEAEVSAPASANIGIRPAVNTSQSATQPPIRSMAVTVQSDERVVMTRSDRTASAQRQTASQRSHSNDVEPQEAKPIARSFKTSAKTTTDLNHVGSAIAKAESIKIDPGEGISEREYLSRLSTEAQQEYLLKKQEKKSAYIQTPDPSTVVASIRKSAKVTQTDGFTTTLSVGGGSEITDLSGLDSGKAVLSEVFAEGLTFRNTNGPKRAFTSVVTKVDEPATASALPTETPSKGNIDARRLVAKAVCSDFPDDYDFNDHWKRRMARIQLHYSDSLSVIRAIFAAESDDFKRLILEEFPSAFQS